jgi:antitoxin (DNA-binding transcriptional repressor) of toxin-antitoxin stability system
MNTVDIGQADIANCISAAQSQPIVVTQDGEPIALIVGVAGMDEEQISLGTSAEFWRMIQQRRGQPTISRSELENHLASE